MSSLLVLLVGALTVASALVTVSQKNPVYAALAMLPALVGVAALMLGLRAPFLAAMQILLYGGAIMVLFVFVIMLLSLRADELGPEPPMSARLVAALGGFGALAVVLYAISRRGGGHFGKPVLDEAYGSTQHFARFLYTDYVVAFELITVLVMAAAAGVIVLARKPGQGHLENTRLVHDPARHSATPEAPHHGEHHA